MLTKLKIAIVFVVSLCIASPLLADGESKYVSDLRTAAEQGDAKAQYDLGNAYLVGIGVAKNSAEALKWLRHASEQGYVKAESALGTIYYQGSIVPKNNPDAIKWWTKAAEAKDPDAESQLGFAYMLGDGVPKNSIYAYMWFNLAATHGDKHATKDRDTLAKFMNADQIAESQRLATEVESKTSVAH